MESPNFGGVLPGNNAPPPIFGGTNPTGSMPGGFSTKESLSFPNYPMFGPVNNGIVTPTANLPLFGATGQSGMVPAGSSGTGGIQGLSSGFSGRPTDPKTIDELGRQLRNDYGNGMGEILTQILTGGLFNPQVANAFLNAMQPAYNRGIASVENAFGAEGSRFGSAAALGIGDFSSQFNLNEQQTLAQMYMAAQQEQLSLLENILPTVHAENADSQAGFLSTLADIFSFGSLGPAFQNIANNAKGAGGSSSAPNIGMPAGTPSTSPTSGTGGGSPNVSSLLQNLLGASAGADLGGASSSTGDISSLLMFGAAGA